MVRQAHRVLFLEEVFSLCRILRWPGQQISLLIRNPDHSQRSYRFMTNFPDHLMRQRRSSRCDETLDPIGDGTSAHVVNPEEHDMVTLLGNTCGPDTRLTEYVPTANGSGEVFHVRPGIVSSVSTLILGTTDPHGPWTLSDVIQY